MRNRRHRRGAPPDSELLERMARRMAHRGPDGQRIWSDGRAGLAFRRLAIIDLDERSMQPLHLGPWHLVLNGEIYNYRELRAELVSLGHAFVTEGDGEVLLHAWAEWEEAALDRLDGMFAFAIWNDERRELLCACDPFGEKPLFWAHDGDQLVFASDVEAVLEARPDLGAPRLEALGPYLGRGLMPPIDESFFASINRLPGAHLLRLHDGGAVVRRYWRPVSSMSRRATRTPSNGCASCSWIRFACACAPTCRSAPRSAAVSTPPPSWHSRPRSPATTGATPSRRAFPGSPATSGGTRTMSLGPHTSSSITPSSRLPRAPGRPRRLVSAQEEPFGSTSIYAQWCVMRAARDAGVTVLLDGQGADEIFGGYPGSNGWALRSMGPRRASRARLRT